MNGELQRPEPVRPDLERPGAEAMPPPATGRPEVDAALESLTNLDHLTPREQVSRYTEVHGALRETLGAIDAA